MVDLRDLSEKIDKPSLNRLKHDKMFFLTKNYFNFDLVLKIHLLVEEILTFKLSQQHVPSTRSVDDYVWEEIRNFKKCLIMMFGEQEKDVMFLETVMGLGQQRRHCMVECVPLARELAEEAPHYFKMVSLYVVLILLLMPH